MTGQPDRQIVFMKESYFNNYRLQQHPSGNKVKLDPKGLPDTLIELGSRDKLKEFCGLDLKNIAKWVISCME